MVWVKVDDKFWAKERVLNAFRTNPASLALWIRALSYCGDQLTDGVISRNALPMLEAKQDQIDSLLQAGLWVETPKGYEFRKYASYNPTAEKLEIEREKARKRKEKYERNRNRKGTRSERVQNGNRTREEQCPEPEPEPEKKTTRDKSLVAKEKRATPIPDTWQPNDKHREYAHTHMLPLQREADAFRDHAIAHGRKLKDWDAGFRTWLRKALDYQSAHPQQVTDLWTDSNGERTWDENPF